MENVDGIIASDLDYHLALKENPKYKGLIPNPINTNNLAYFPLELSEKVVIFHGINRENYYKKGSDFFEQALEKLAASHGDKIEIITAESLPYKEYIKSYDKAHIVLDQVYSYDQGYNALEAMSRGKVVLTGLAPEFLEHYELQGQQIAINALPRVKYLYEVLMDLVDNPEQLLKISKGARAFILEHHDHMRSAALYESAWTS